MTVASSPPLDRPTQTRTLLRMLREAGEDGVNAMQVLHRGGGFRAAARIWDLKQQGHKITTIRHPGRCATYILETV